MSLRCLVAEITTYKMEDCENGIISCPNLIEWFYIACDPEAWVYRETHAEL